MMRSADLPMRKPDRVMLPGAVVLPADSVVMLESAGGGRKSCGVMATPGGVMADSGGVMAEPGGVRRELAGMVAESGGVMLEPGGAMPARVVPTRKPDLPVREGCGAMPA